MCGIEWLQLRVTAKNTEIDGQNIYTNQGQTLQVEYLVAEEKLQKLCGAIIRWLILIQLKLTKKKTIP